MMNYDRGFWVRLYLGGLIFCLLLALVLNLFIGFGFVGPDYPGAPGPYHGPYSLLNGVARGEFGIEHALLAVLSIYFTSYAIAWTIMLSVFLICAKVVKWIGKPNIRE